MKELETSVSNLHKEGKTAKEIADIVNTGKANVWRIAKKLNIKFEGSGGKNRILNHNPFDDTDESWYWIGYLAADGNISKNKFNISIVSKDIQHLLRFKTFINANITEYYRDSKLTLHFGNKEVYYYLKLLGFTPNKSLTLKMNCNINSAFVRGVIDGDGFFSKTRRTTHKITSGSKEFLEQIQQFLKENNIDSVIGIQQNNIHITYSLRIYNKYSKVLYDLLYENASVYMERKEIILRRAAEMLYK